MVGAASSRRWAAASRDASLCASVSHVFFEASEPPRDPPAQTSGRGQVCLLSLLLKKRGGAIVNTSSRGRSEASPVEPRTACKVRVVGLTKAAALENDQQENQGSLQRG